MFRTLRPNARSTNGCCRLDESSAAPASLPVTLKPFNPFTETPVEGVNWVKGPNFGKPISADALQLADRSLAPRTYRLSLGLRF